jgi:hypothetical protein
MVFTAARGKPMDPRHVLRAVTTAANQIELEGVTVHTLRHSVATLMLGSVSTPRVSVPSSATPTSASPPRPTPPERTLHASPWLGSLRALLLRRLATLASALGHGWGRATQESKRPPDKDSEEPSDEGVLLVGDTGIEPVTSSVSGKRATAAPIAHARWRRDLNPCTRICSPLPRLSATPPGELPPRGLGENRSERTTGFEPATLTLAR